MDHQNIEELLMRHPAVLLLKLRNAHWVLPFLYKVFKEEDQFMLSEERLIHLLTETLADREGLGEDLEEANIHFGEDEQARSRKYLLNWVQKRILQDMQHTDGSIQYQLSAYTEKTFQWLLSLQDRKHVGTESRFKLLLTSLRDIVENTEGDRKKRLENLKNKRAELDKEIKAIELGIAPENYTNSQVQERLELFTRQCYELISDFREVEDNFKKIHRNIVEQHTKAEQNKGAIVGYAFEAYDGLRNSSQGRSFYAFWEFLISRSGQEEWKELTEQLMDLLIDRSIQADENFLKNVKSLLLQQGKTVYDANDKMADKLSRIITEKEIARHRRLRKQINAIKEKAFELMEEEVTCGLNLEEKPEIRMVMDRPLSFHEKKINPVLKQPVSGVETIADPERFSRMLNTSTIDKKYLWSKVEKALARKNTATLKEVLELQPLEQGLAEIVSYYGFAKDKPGRVQVIANTTELIPMNSQESLWVNVPYLLFSK